MLYGLFNNRKCCCLVNRYKSNWNRAAADSDSKTIPDGVTDSVPVAGGSREAVSNTKSEPESVSYFGRSLITLFSRFRSALARDLADRQRPAKITSTLVFLIILNIRKTR
jgi:hypothetical protein